jgi:5-methylthioadenosine/S-adenosylhomocysteine deaminase
VTLLGGGADIYRTDDPAFGDAHCAATRESGLRTMLAVGPGRLPLPQQFRRIEDDSAQCDNADIALTFERQLEVSEDLIHRHNDILGRRTGICLIMPVYNSDDMAASSAEITTMSEAVANLRDRTGVLFTQDGHRNGSIDLARKLGVLGPFALLSHSVDLTEADFKALTETGANIVHNPSAIMSVYGRCSAPELIEAGVTVALGSDAGAPDRGFDMFRHMSQCMHYHRRHFRDPSYMPPGKVLEMATIDAPRALGLDSDLGSLETGKKADIVLVDMRKLHLWPPNMPVTRLAHFANAADVDTVIVDRKVFLRNRRPTQVDETSILQQAATELTEALRITGLEHLTIEPTDYWETARRNTEGFPARTRT